IGPIGTQTIANLGQSLLLPRKTTYLAEIHVPIAASLWKQIIADEMALWFVGIVDYKDRFGKMHQAGYGRRYDPTSGHLVFDQTTGPLNYDRQLQPEEKKKYT